MRQAYDYWQDQPGSPQGENTTASRPQRPSLRTSPATTPRHDTPPAQRPPGGRQLAPAAHRNSATREDRPTVHSTPARTAPPPKERPSAHTGGPQLPTETGSQRTTNGEERDGTACDESTSEPELKTTEAPSRRAGQPRPRCGHRVKQPRHKPAQQASTREDPMLSAQTAQPTRAKKNQLEGPHTRTPERRRRASRTKDQSTGTEPPTPAVQPTDPTRHASPRERRRPL